MARKVRQMRGKGNHIGLVPVPSMAAPDLDTRIALIQALIPVALEKVHVEVQADVERLAGERYVREGRRLGHVRWTVQRGSMYLADQKIPLAVPRVGVVARIVTGSHDANRQESHLPMRYDTGRPRAVIRLRISQPRTTSLPCPAGLRARRPAPMMDL